MDVSFVIPVYNERESLRLLVEKIQANVPNISYEIILVNDGSDDGSGDVLSDLASEIDIVTALDLPHHAGKTAALTKGFQHATGDIVFTLDSDLQDDPAEIPMFLNKLEEGFDLVCGWKSTRHHPWHRNLASAIYNFVVHQAFHVQIHDVNCGFKAMRSEVAKSLGLHHDMHRLIPVIAARKGYKITEIAVIHHARRFGKSKYGLHRLIDGVRDVVWLRFRG